MINIRRCLKPKDATGSPILIIFSDGSKDAYGACAYVRWSLTTGGYESRLVMSKSRLAPTNKRISIDRVELCGAVLNKKVKNRNNRTMPIQIPETLPYHRFSNRARNGSKGIITDLTRLQQYTLERSKKEQTRMIGTGLKESTM